MTILTGTEWKYTVNDENTFIGLIVLTQTVALDFTDAYPGLIAFGCM